MQYDLKTGGRQSTKPSLISQTLYMMHELICYSVKPFLLLTTLTIRKYNIAYCIFMTSYYNLGADTVTGNFAR